MNKELMVLVEWTQSYLDAVEWGDGEYMAIYGRAINKLINEIVKSPYYNEEKAHDLAWQMRDFYSKR